MSAQPLDSRIAHLEGVNEQIVERVSDLRSDFASLRSEFGGLRSDFGYLRSEFAEVRGEMSTQFRWIVGFQITTLMSVVLAGVSGVLALIFRH